ncbi:glycosyltransferase [Pseudoroseomonas cervicalis]|uniref:glycosyltransferase n=1 Tax=Teichococcus cervicalis TaxID=204525 RepID=UPI00277F7CEB|nr:glycosyltransferase [Pseudoroseomonas cervicalis]MDQ1079562.1 GT2 family glycosyltransferase [Pseudoroseomonas cervicalis]
MAPPPGCHGALDAMLAGSGFIMVDGWLACPPGHDWPDPVWLEIAGQRFAITQWFSRPDLPADPAGPLFRAFRQDFPLPQDATAEPLHLTLPGLPAPLVSAAADRWRPYRPSGHIERGSQAGMSGWVYDPGLWHSDSQAELELEGLGARFTLSFTLDRPDLTGGVPLPGRKLGFALSAAEIAAQLDPLLPFREGAACTLVLRSSGQELSRREMPLAPLSHGRLEGHARGLVRGWAAMREHPYAVPLVELRIEGIPYAQLLAERGRKDLLEKGVTTGAGGFALPLQVSPHDADSILLEARVMGEAEPLPGTPVRIEGLPPQRGAGAAPWRGLAAGRPRVAIVIPVYNAAEELAQCLEAVLAHTGPGAELIVIDDASPDPAVGAVLARHAGRPGLRILRNDSNLGFTATCNRGIALAGRDDVVLLNSDTLPPERWLENLVLAAYSGPDIATASPLSDNAGAFSAPELNRRNDTPPGLTPSQVSRLVMQHSPAVYPEMPTGHGFCLYIRRAALDAVGPLDAEAFPRGYGEENEFCMRAARAGWRHVIDDRTYMPHRQSASFGAAKAALLAAGRAVVDARYPEYSALVRALPAHEQLPAMRWRVRRAFRDAARPPRPRILYVISTETGGTPQTNLDLMRTLEDRYEPWLLRSDGRVLSLQRLERQELQPVDQAVLPTALHPGTHRSAAYDECVAAWLLRHAIELVHIRHLAWHGLGLPAVAAALGIPVVHSFHDFYSLCPTIKLLDGAMRHCAGDCARGEGECRAELWPADWVPPLRGQFVPRWRAMMQQALAPADAFVTTADSAHALIARHLPGLAAHDWRVLPHGRDFAEFLPPAATAPGAGPLRILVPGNISPAKGGDLVRRMAELDGGARLEFHILGDHGWLQPMPGLVLHGRYRREDFLDHVRRIGAQLGAVFSVWPETYCHTLTEMWAAGLPVLALDLGAVGERIRRHGGGWLFPPQPAETLLAAILDSLAGPETVGARLREVRAWQEGEGSSRSNAAMAADYDRLYRDVWARRRSFAAAAPAGQA